jgi:DNA polymerase-1
MSTQINEVHAKYLRDRAIDVDVAIRNGVYSADAAGVAAALGRESAPGPGLVFPYPLRGKYVRVRTDDAGYLCPAGKSVELYIPTDVHALATCLTQLLIVESPAKALALLGVGLPAVGLGGVETCLDLKDGQRVLASTWDPLVLTGVEVVVLFDSNRRVNPNVARGEARLAMALEKAGASLRIAALPPASNGDDQGPDDYLAACGESALRAVIEAAQPADPLVRLHAFVSTKDRVGAEAFLGQLPTGVAIGERGCGTQAAMLAESLKIKGILKRTLATAKRELAEAARKVRVVSPGGEYSVANGCMVERTPGGDVVLANFTAEALFDLDDGEGNHRFVISGKSRNGHPLHEITLDADDLSDPQWALRKWGAHAQIRPVSHAAHRVCSAIFAQSSPKTERIYTHTGWTTINGTRTFVHGGGALGGLQARIALRGPVRHCVLPENADQAAALAAAFAVLAVEPSVMIALLAVAMSAPLCEFAPMSGVVWLVGPSGIFKTSLAMLILAFFGAHGEGALLPFSSTSPGIELALFEAKDNLVVLDDYAPKTTDPRDPSRTKIMDVQRAFANASERQRLDQDLNSRSARPPRCALLVTGEEPPPGESVLARGLVVSVKGTIDREKLSAAQHSAGLLGGAMVGYLTYIRDNWEYFASNTAARQEYWRDRAYQIISQTENCHMRRATLVGELMTGLEAFLAFAVSATAIDAQCSDQWLDYGLQTLSTHAHGDTGHRDDEDPVHRFVATLSSLLATGAAILAEQRRADIHGAGQQNVIGWRLNDEILLQPDAAYRTVALACRSSGRPFPISAASLWGRMADRGMLLLPDKSDRPTAQRRIGSMKQRVLVVRPSLLGLDEASPNVTAASQPLGDSSASQEPLEIPGVTGDLICPVPSVPTYENRYNPPSSEINRAYSDYIIDVEGGASSGGDSGDSGDTAPDGEDDR